MRRMANKSKVFTSVCVLTLCVLLLASCSNAANEDLINEIADLKSQLIELQTKTSEPTPSAAPEILFKNADSTVGVTFDMYHAIQIGMSYDEVVDIIGDYGIYVAETPNSFTCKWNSPYGHGGSFVQMRFTDNNLVTKTPDGFCNSYYNSEE